MVSSTAGVTRTAKKRSKSFMWCMLSGRRMEAKLSEKVGPGNGDPVDFADLPERERPIVACAFRGFVMDGYLAGRPEPGWGDVVAEALGFFGCDRSAGSVRTAHAVARDYYARGTMFAVAQSPRTIPVTDTDALVSGCVALDPAIRRFTLDFPDRKEQSLADAAAKGGILGLSLVAQHDVPLDEAYVVRGTLAKGLLADGVMQGRNEAAVRSFLLRCGGCVSGALFEAYRSDKERIEDLIQERHVDEWLKKNGVQPYVKGQYFNLVATRAGTPAWWLMGGPAPRGVAGSPAGE